jgi:nitrite transporter NirC
MDRKDRVPLIPAPASGSTTLTYEETCEKWGAIGARHASSHWTLFIVRSLFTGFYLNLSFTLGVRARVQSTGQEILFGLFFSFGLVFITLTDSFLFTQDIATVTLSILIKKTPLIQGVKSLIFTFLFNYVGSILGAYFFGHACAFFSDPQDPVRNAIILSGQAKVSLGIGAMLSRAMFCNWMVCLANFLQAKTDSIGAKIVCVCLPISTFATLNLEHGIVNMSILTMCLFLDGNAFSIGAYFVNIVVVTLGNIIGAILTMTLPAYYTLWLKQRTESQLIAQEAPSEHELTTENVQIFQDPMNPPGEY